MNLAASLQNKSILSALTLILACLAVCSPAVLPAAPEGARTVPYAKQDIVAVRAKVRFSTLIVLPEGEEILDFTTGDKDFWIINGAHNLCYIHPAQTGIRSNLNLVTASGQVYSFLLTEVSNEPGSQPDLKIFLEPKDGPASSANGAVHGFVRAEEAEAYKKELEALRIETSDELQSTRAQSEREISRFRSEYQAKLRFDFTVNGRASREPFLVTAIYHDDAFTYIQSAAQEKPALYEIKDGKPNLIDYQLQNGVYIAPKVLDQGYLAIGAKKLTFSRKDSTR